MPSIYAKKFKSIIDSEWEKTIFPVFNTEASDFRPMSWSTEVTPPFPSLWFPTPDSALFYYLYAYVPGYVIDGELQGTIWARIEIGHGKEATPKFVRMAESVSELGIQGFQMLNQDETDLFRQADAIETYLQNLTAPPDENSEKARISKQFYHFWISYNGVLANEIWPRHEDFFRWAMNTKNVAEPLKKSWWKWWQ